MNANTSLFSRATVRIGVVALAVVASAVSGGVALASFNSAPAVSHGSTARTCFYRATVQSGSTTSTANGLKTVTITAVTMSKAFLLFSTSHNLNRPVGSEVSGRLTSTTTLEFNRVTDEASPATITIQWSVVEYNCGVTVQRGSVAPAATTNNVTITAVNSTADAFTTFSKTPTSTDSSWDSNDPTVVELTSTTNLQFRVDAAVATHTIHWQVVEFTDSTMIKVQRGTTSLTGATTSTTATLGTAVNTAHTFVLVSTRATGSGTDIGSGLVRGTLTNSTTVTLDRSAANYNVTEIAWQAVELKEGSTVQNGSATVASAAASGTVSLTAVTLARSNAFASGMSGGGTNCGRTAYTTDDVLGVACFTLALTSTTQLTLTRANTAAAADVGWFVVSWGLP